jgi:diguanylate cyclase (GGDEF)-like protein/hemerythrin-like metal-binding protein/PAS domain S-box-containing protein
VVERLRKQNQVLDTLLSDVDAHIYIKDREGRFLYVSQSVAELLGRPVEEIVGHFGAESMACATVEPFHASDPEVLARGGRQSREETLVDVEGNVHCFQTVRIPLGHGGQPYAILGLSTDLSELHQLREELERRATFDSLTGLVNREHFLHEAHAHFARAQRQGEALALLVLEIDDFKSINDQYGHQVGDRVLCGVAEHCRQVVRDGDLIGRVGGDEFAILLPDMGLDPAVQLADSLRQSLSKLQFETQDGHTLSVTVSTGAASLHHIDANLDRLYSRADQALRHAREAGRDRVESITAHQTDHVGSSLHLIWQASDDCGEPVIDREHRELIRLANELLDVAMAEAPATGFNAALDALLSHVIVHFAHEEAILRRLGYADVDHHAELHRHLIERALALSDQAEGQGIAFGELVEFLAKDVVARHLLHADRAFFGLFDPTDTSD